MKTSQYSRALYIAITFSCALILSASIHAESKLTNTAAVDRTGTLVHDGVIDANRVFCYVTNDGGFGRDFVGELNLAGGGGLVFPFINLENIESGLANKTALFAAGIWLAAVDSITGDTLAALAEYSSEYVPGPMSGGAAQPDNAAFRIYKLYRDSLAGAPNQDYLNWPVDQGAPTAPGGVPLLRGDQTLWTVYNDAAAYAHTNDAGSTAPLGVEVHQLMWASDPDDYPDTVSLDSIITVTGPTHAGDPYVYAIIKDSKSLTGDNYSVVIVEDTGLGLYWRLLNTTLNTVVLDSQTNFSGDTNYPIVDGIQVFVQGGPRPVSWEYESANPLNVSPVAAADNGYTGGARWFTGGDHGGELFFGGVFLEPNFWGATTLPHTDYTNVEVRFRPMSSYTDLNGDGEYTIGEPYVVDDPSQTQKAFMYQSFGGYTYEGFYDIPFTAWDISNPGTPRQLNVVVRDRDANHQWDLHHSLFDNALPNSGDQRFHYTWILGTDYDPTGTMYGDGSGGSKDFFDGPDGAVYDAMWVMWLDERGTTRGQLAEECAFRMVLRHSLTPADTFTFAVPDAHDGQITAGGDANAFYVKYTLINNGSRYLKNFHIGVWADPDLGGSGDDLIGCDPQDNVFFCYNAAGTDNIYGAAPPAFGIKIVEGPLVPAPGQTGSLDGEPVADHRNLDLSAFKSYFNGIDPTNARETFYYFKGLDKNGDAVINPVSLDTTTFEVTGDPVTGTGWLDSSPSDRRLLGSVGPLSLNPGDTQYITIKVALGQGANRLESITKLREILNAPYDIPTDVRIKDDAPLPQTFALSQNYPNPFNPSTKIEFSLPTQSDVRLDIYNLLGQRVATLVNQRLSAGVYTADWNASGFASGIYLYRLTADKTQLSRKMLLVK